MEIEEKKKIMKSWKDNMGFDIVDTQAIDDAQTSDDLRKVLEAHINWLEAAVGDAERSVEELKRTIEIEN